MNFLIFFFNPKLKKKMIEQKKLTKATTQAINLICINKIIINT